MDDIGTLVYLLIAVVWLIYSFFTKGKKEQAERGEETNSEGREMDARELLEEMLGKSKKSQPQPVRQQESKRTEYREEKSLEEIEQKPVWTFDQDVDKYATPESSEKITNEIGKKSSRKIKDKIKDRIKLEEIGAEPHEAVAGFDPQKAVIWSEIINRPYN